MMLLYNHRMKEIYPKRKCTEHQQNWGQAVSRPYLSNHFMCLTLNKAAVIFPRCLSDVGNLS